MIGLGMLAGAGIGLGLVLIVRGMFPGPRPLATALAELHGSGRAAPAPAADTGRWERLRHRVVHGATSALEVAGVRLGGLDADLRMMKRSLEQHVLEKLTAALAGLALPVVVGGVLRLGGIRIGLGTVAIAAAALAVAGLLLPDLLLRNQAAERRRAFDFALSSYLDLVRVILAAGAGVETALQDAANLGHGHAFRRLRGALARARTAGDSPWAAFRRLGEELDLPALREVAASLALAGTHGAKLRESLAARAESMRSRDLATTEAAAEAATERMSVPSVLLVVGFIVFVGFPAAIEILGY